GDLSGDGGGLHAVLRTQCHGAFDDGGGLVDALLLAHVVGADQAGFLGEPGGHGGADVLASDQRGGGVTSLVHPGTKDGVVALVVVDRERHPVGRGLGDAAREAGSVGVGGDPQQRDRGLTCLL